MSKELSSYLSYLEHAACYRVDVQLKETDAELTEKVFFQGSNGSELGPFIRKTILLASKLGVAYKKIFDAQCSGKRFLHIPRIIECYETDEHLVVVMEYVNGETLEQLIQRCGSSTQVAASIFPSLCDAVTELHEEFALPLIHRDIKPSNVMVSKDVVTLIDFGITREFKDNKDDDTCHFGTRTYAPPEQFGFKQTDIRSDVYALGVLLYFCLTGKTPDLAKEKEDLKTGQLPKELRTVIKKATAFNPSDRYQTVAELKSASKQALELLLSSARHLKPAPTAKGLFQRIPFSIGVAWSTVLASLFLVLVALSSSLVLYPNEESGFIGLSIGMRAAQAGSIVFLLVGPVLFLLCDRRVIRRLFPRFSNVSLSRSVAVCLAIFIVGIILLGTLIAFEG